MLNIQIIAVVYIVYVDNSARLSTGYATAKKRIGMFPKRRTMNKYVCVFKKEGDNKHLSQCKEKKWKQDDICDGGYVCGIWRV